MQPPTLNAYPEAPAIWVWDDALLDEYGVSLKRILFMYETLLELPVTIRRGDVAAQIMAFTEEHGARMIATTFSPSPRFTEITMALEQANYTVELWDPAPLVDPHIDFDLKRFSRYWRKAEQYAMQPTE